MIIFNLNSILECRNERTEHQTQSSDPFLLCEATDIASTCRITGAAKNTGVKLPLEVGEACNAYQDRVLRNLNYQSVQQAARESRRSVSLHFMHHNFCRQRKNASRDTSDGSGYVGDYICSKDEVLMIVETADRRVATKMNLKEPATNL